MSQNEDKLSPKFSEMIMIEDKLDLTKFIKIKQTIKSDFLTFVTFVEDVDKM